MTSRAAGSWWWAGRTRGARSRSNSPRHTPSNSPWANDCRRFLNGHWVATCGRGRRHCTWIESPRSPASVDACPSGIRSSGPGHRQLTRRHAVRLRPRVTGAAGRAVDLRRRLHRRVRRRALGDRLHPRQHLDRHSRRHRRGRTDSTVTGRHTLSRPVHARPHLATHPRLRAARLGRQRRRLPRPADRSHQRHEHVQAPRPAVHAEG